MCMYYMYVYVLRALKDMLLLCLVTVNVRVPC